MKKLTLHEKAKEGFMCANNLLNYAHRIKYYAEEYDLRELNSIANSMETDALAFRDKLK
jgi:hypothetical protein